MNQREAGRPRFVLIAAEGFNLYKLRRSPASASELLTLPGNGPTPTPKIQVSPTLASESRVLRLVRHPILGRYGAMPVYAFRFDHRVIPPTAPCVILLLLAVGRRSAANNERGPERPAGRLATLLIA